MCMDMPEGRTTTLEVGLLGRDVHDGVAGGEPRPVIPAHTDILELLLLYII